ncbi:MAG: hypothetical protein M1837_002213 [Sclerophora amabilis]|nr:MAG: hypothetical protein M1837_002213 [Sclerophora amabilis]
MGMEYPALAHDDIQYPDLAADGSSDYGSEFDTEEEQQLSELLSNLPLQVDQTKPDLALEGIEGDDVPRAARVPRRLGREEWKSVQDSLDAQDKKAQVPSVSVEIEGYSGPSNVQGESSYDDGRVTSLEPTPDPDVPDARSPLARFRTAPKKALSVTDMISPSWCELQYWYTLTKHGRKRRTPAMRQGSVIHKNLEEEVHRAVAINVTTKEDSWGLRIWNIIQGLRTLRETGMTREFEVWGLVDGLLVNGVIDELSYLCPDRELEEQAYSKNVDNRKIDNTTLPANQTSIDSFVFSSRSKKLKDTVPSSGNVAASLTLSPTRQKVYITDVKTRSSKSLPSGASFRPTLMQLMLYRRLLTDLASNNVDPFVLYDRYNLDPHTPFTDSFIAQIGSLHHDNPFDPSQHAFPPSSSPSSSFPPASSQDSLQLLLSHNSLHHLWTLLTESFQQTFPAGAASVAEVLKAEYRNAADGAILGAKTFLHDDAVIHNYLQDEIRWWRGEREPVGVTVEEAYKCRFCEFADGCTWREGKVEEATRIHRNSR